MSSTDSRASRRLGGGIGGGISAGRDRTSRGPRAPELGPARFPAGSSTAVVRRHRSGRAPRGPPVEAGGQPEAFAPEDPTVRLRPRPPGQRRRGPGRHEAAHGQPSRTTTRGAPAVAGGGRHSRAHPKSAGGPGPRGREGGRAWRRSGSRTGRRVPPGRAGHGWSTSATPSGTAWSPTAASPARSLRLPDARGVPRGLRARHRVQIGRVAMVATPAPT